MIKTFADRHTQEMYDTGKSKRFPPDLWKRAIRKLEYIDLATRLEDLKVPPSNRLHELERERKGQFSLSVNDQWRICFRFIDGDAYDVGRMVSKHHSHDIARLLRGAHTD